MAKGNRIDDAMRDRIKKRIGAGWSNKQVSDAFEISVMSAHRIRHELFEETGDDEIMHDCTKEYK